MPRFATAFRKCSRLNYSRFVVLEITVVHEVSNRLEYIVLLNLPIILSSNSFLFYLLFPFLFFFILIYSPPTCRSTIKLLTIKTHGSESWSCKVESTRRNIMTRPLHMSILQEGTLWKFRLLLLTNRLCYRSETLYQCLICS